MSEPIWVSSRRAALVWGVSQSRVGKIANASDVRLKILPGCKPRFCLQDVERIGRQSIVGGPVKEPATA